MSARLTLWWRALTRRRTFERDLDEELAFHRDARRNDLIAQGVSPAEAARQARLELGMVELHRDDCRRARGIVWVDTLVRDLRYAVRGLLRNRGYSLTALCVLGMAIAANTLLFALFHGYALRAPAIDRIDGWVTLRGIDQRQARLDRWSAADADALLRTPPAAFEGLYWLRDLRLHVEADVARPAFGEAVSGNYFDLLGVRAARGRTFLGAEHPDDADTVVLSDLGWRRLTNADPNVLGRTIELSGRAFTVIGVTPDAFSGTTIASPMFWIRDTELRAMRPDEFDAIPRVDVGGILRPDASADEAAAAVSALVLARNADKPEDERLTAALVERRTGYLRAGDIEELVTIGTPIGVAFAALLLVAAANLANLVLARFAARRRELAVRAAVGASRIRMLVQLLTECMVLAIAAAILGFVLATLTIDPLHNAVFGLLGNFGMELRSMSVSPGVFGYALGLALLAALTFGGVPALLVTAPWRRGFSAQPDLAALQRPGHTRLRSALMATQFAASVVLLVLATLIAGNARIAERLALGYDPARVVALQIDRPTERLRDAVLDLPQVEAVSVVADIPLMGAPPSVEAKAGQTTHRLRLRTVDASYFDVLDVPVVRGRGFARGDERSAPGVVVSRRTAERLWPGEQPLGQVLILPPQESLASSTVGQYAVIGVVEDVVSGMFINGVDTTAVYLPATIEAPAMRSLMVRLRDSSAAALEAVERTCVNAEPLQNCDLLPLQDALRLQHTPFLMAANITAALGWTALAISCLGLYGLTSYLVLQRRREIGVRLALGATGARIVRNVLARSAWQVGGGLAIGLPVAVAAAWFATRVLPSLHTLDPIAFVVVPLLLTALALAAAWLPARRVARSVATDALRDD